MDVGFTGTQRGMSMRQLAALRDELTRRYEPGARAHHGCCVGADTQFHDLAGSLGYAVVLHPPVNESKMTPIENLRRLAPVAEVREPDEYLVRNHHIVDAADVLLAGPESDAEVLRSGTWSTIRYGRRSGLEVVVLQR